MKRAGVAEVKAHLSRYLEQVKGGEEVVITERGRPVARLVPLGVSEGPESRRARLIRAGLLLPGSGRMPRLLRTPPRGPLVGTGVLEALLDERSSGR